MSEGHSPVKANVECCKLRDHFSCPETDCSVTRIPSMSITGHYSRPKGGLVMQGGVLLICRRALNVLGIRSRLGAAIRLSNFLHFLEIFKILVATRALHCFYIILFNTFLWFYSWCWIVSWWRGGGVCYFQSFLFSGLWNMIYFGGFEFGCGS